MIQEFATSDILQRVAAQTLPKAKPAAIAEATPTQTDSAPWTMPGFGAGAKVETSFGHVPVEALRKRDPIRTSDGRFLRVTSVDTIQLDRRFLLTQPNAQPILIPKDSLGAGAPERDMMVSGAQKLMRPYRFDEKMGKRADELIGQNFIIRKMSGYFSYHIFRCGEPCTVNVDGVWTPID